MIQSYFKYCRSILLTWTDISVLPDEVNGAGIDTGLRRLHVESINVNRSEYQEYDREAKLAMSEK